MPSAVSLYRVSSRLHRLRIPYAPRLIDYLARFLFAAWVPHTARIGKRAVLGYGGLGIVIHDDARIGDDVHIDQGVTIGGNATQGGVPTIGQNVYIGAGAKILGPIVIGENSIIGANAVVIRDVPANSVAVGVPARVIGTAIDSKATLFHRRQSS